MYLVMYLAGRFEILWHKFRCSWRQDMRHSFLRDCSFINDDGHQTTVLRSEWFCIWREWGYRMFTDTPYTIQHCTIYSQKQTTWHNISWIHCNMARLGYIIFLHSLQFKWALSKVYLILFFGLPPSMAGLWRTPLPPAPVFSFLQPSSSPHRCCWWRALVLPISTMLSSVE